MGRCHPAFLFSLDILPRLKPWEDVNAAFEEILTRVQIAAIESRCTHGTQTRQFAFLRDEDEFYVIHKDSGTIINWYKHLGRTNTCNKPGFTLEDLREFLQLLKEDINDSL